MSLKLTILGCGSSGGVPRIGGLWGNCDPNNTKNRRQRCSVLVQRGTGDKMTQLLIDTSPDLRHQLLDNQITTLDGVLYTHEHADHIHGIDELRVLAINNRERIRVWADQNTGDMLQHRFSYCFKTPPGSNYPPIIDLNDMQANQPVTVTGAAGDITALPFNLKHGNITALGFRIGGLAYTPDLHDIPEQSLAALENLDTWIIDALRIDPHPSHLNLEQALSWIERLKPKQAVLTNLHIDMDYETLTNQLPAHIRPAYDYMQVAITN